MSTVSPVPKTLTFSTATLRNERTLVWLQQQSCAVPWWKWDGVVSSLDDYHKWLGYGASIVGMVLCDGLDGLDRMDRLDAWLDEVYQVAKKVQYMMLPRAVIMRKTAEYWKENFDNVFQLEELHESYPFLGGAWNGSARDAIHMLALIGRYHRMVDVVATAKSPIYETVRDVSRPIYETVRDTSRPIYETVRDTSRPIYETVVDTSRPIYETVRDTSRPIYETVVEEGTRPVEFVLFTQLYTATEKKRTLELVECLKRNVKCKWVDRVVLLNEKDESAMWSSFPAKYRGKIEQRVVGHRLTYADFFQEVVRRYPNGSGLNAVVALANADMYMGEEMAEVWRIRWEDRAVCLLRWDDLGEGPSQARLFGPRADSQDVWMFSAASIASRHWTKEVDISLGKPGCDNAILRHLLQQRFLLSNPALSLKTYHLHNSGVRSYGKGDTIFSPVYIHLEPTYLVDTKQEFTPKESPSYLCNESVSFSVKSSSMSNEITYCTMLEKEGRYRWEPMVENYYFEPAIPVYSWNKGADKGAGVTANGLVYDLYHIYTGRSAIQQPEYNYWPSANIDIFTPMTSCPRMVAIPLADADAVFGDRGAYLLFYLSRYLRIRSTLPKDTFLGFYKPGDDKPSDDKPSDDIFGTLDMAQGIPWEKGTACWANEVVGYLPGPSVSELGREDITMLRDHDGKWQMRPVSDGRTCVVVGDDLLTGEWIEALRALLPASWHIKRVGHGVEYDEDWYGASLCIVVGGPGTYPKWSPLWRLPKGAVLLEFQQELVVSGECQHIAHMADLSSWIFLLSKGSSESIRADILSSIQGWWKKNHSLFMASSPSPSPNRSLPHV